MDGLMGRRGRPDASAVCGAPPFWARFLDSGHWESLCGIFEFMCCIHKHPSLGPVSLLGAKALTWLQMEPRCGWLNPTVFQTLEVDRGCQTYVCVCLPGAWYWHSRASWRDRALPRPSVSRCSPSLSTQLWGGAPGRRCAVLRPP